MKYVSSMEDRKSAVANLQRASVAAIGEEMDDLPSWKLRIHLILDHPYFDRFMGLVIVINAICVGVESQIEVTYGYGHTYEHIFAWMENVFLLLYTLEAGGRVAAYGRAALQESWVQFDVVLVFIGLCSLAVKSILVRNVQALGAVMTLRIMRLLRLARALRMFVQFKTLWGLVRGILSSMGTIVYTCILLFFFCFMFAIIAIELIAKPVIQNPEKYTEEEYRVVHERFRSLEMSILTFVSCTTVDNSPATYFPLIMEDPTRLFVFVPFLLIVSIALMNLITAVIVESSIQQGEQDRLVARAWELQERAKRLEKLEKLFSDIDENCDGQLTLDELHNAPPKVKEMLHCLCDTDDLDILFTTIDIDNSGFIEIDEFCAGLLRFMDNASLEMLGMDKRIISTLDGVAVLKEQVERNVQGLWSSFEDEYSPLHTQLLEMENSMDQLLESQQLVARQITRDNPLFTSV
jgi:hypothetical protein